MTETFKVGHDVIVLPRGRGREIQPIRARIVKIARVWMEIESTHNRIPTTWRMRKDTQDDGNTDYLEGSVRFFTLEQWERREREAKASAFLREQGINLLSNSPWCRRELELADLLRKAPSGRAAE